MTRFNEVNYDARSETVQVGAGLVWDDVYSALEPHNVSVVGGRVSGIGVAGFTLGGGGVELHFMIMISQLTKATGYSFKSNQYGLTIDTVVGFEIVLPTGIVVNATEKENSDLFWGLKVR